MSGTTPGGTSGDEPDKDPFSKPAQPPSWGQDQPPTWEQDNPARGPYSQETPQPPRPVLTATRLMYAGAALFGLGLVYILATGEAIRDTMRDSAETADQDFTAEEIDTAVNAIYSFNVAIFAIGLILWLWLAWANRRGRSWARVLSTVLGIGGLLFGLMALVGIVIGGVIVALVTIVLAGFVLYLLYRPEASEYYRAVSGRRL